MTSSIPPVLCQCGCGQRAKCYVDFIKMRKTGEVEYKPAPYLPYHRPKKHIKSKTERLAAQTGINRIYHSPLSPELEEFGKRLRFHRQRMMLSQKKLAKELGMFLYRFIQLECGRYSPKRAIGKLGVERARIWVETHTPPSMRPKGERVEDMFAHLDNENGKKRKKKEKQDG